MRLAAPQLLTVVASLVLLSTGCRSVWVHPEASEAKYQNDTAQCKYGISNEELQRILATPTSLIPQYRSDWKRCMTLLGWHTQVRRRSNPPWGSVPRPDES